MKTDQVVDLAKLALLAGGVYVGYRVYTRVRDWGEDVGGALGSTLYDLAHPSTGPDSDTFVVIDGDVYHVIQRPGQPITYRVFSPSLRRYLDPAPGYKLPSNWNSAPRPLAGHPEKRVYGQPWYTPWDGTGKGLQAPLQPLTAADSAIALAQKARASEAGGLMSALFQLSPMGLVYDAATKVWKQYIR